MIHFESPKEAPGTSENRNLNTKEFVIAKTKHDIKGF